MKKMKKFLLVSAILICSLAASAQNSPEQYSRETGIGTDLILDSIFSRESIPMDFIFKWGGNSSLYRVGTSFHFYERNEENDVLTEGTFRSGLNAELFF